MISLFSVLGLFSLAQAQTYELEPQRWFPLELGSYWHYKYEDTVWQYNVVKTADRDTMIAGDRWVGITMIHCDFMPNCSQLGATEYFRFTEDDYLLSSMRDTVDAMYPHSLFKVREATDTLYSSMEQDSVAVGLYTSRNVGNEADTTNLVLSVQWPFPYDHSAYRYKIGDTYMLSAARVAEKDLGDTSFIDRVIREQSSTVVDDTLDWTGYYPLEIGRLWEWTTVIISGLRTAQERFIVGDTLINGISYFKQRAYFLEEDAREQTFRDSTWMEYLRYDSLNTRVVEWSVEKQQDVGYTCRLSASFGRFVACEGLPNAFVSGGYEDEGTQLPVREDFVPYNATKTISNEEGGYTYYHGIGQIPFNPDSVAFSIVFTWLIIDGVEYGEKRIPVAITDEHVPTEPEIHVYPNPTNGLLTIQSPSKRASSIHLYDITGRKTREIKSCVFPCTLNTEHLSPGIYFIKVIPPSPHPKVTQKVIVY